MIPLRYLYKPWKDYWVIKLLVILSSTTPRQLYAHIEISFDEEFISQQAFVDKSEFLAELFRDVGRDFFTCPAFFGKTTNIKMVEKFAQYQWNVNGDPMPWKETHAYKIFKRMNIAKHKDIVSKHIAQHPVISFDLNMENAGIGVFEQLLSRMNSQLSHCFLEHQHKFESYYSSPDVQSELKNWVMKVLETGMSRKELVTNLQYTIEAMNECFDANVVLLIDGFDDFMYRNCEPVEKTYLMFKVFHEMLRNVFESSAKSNVHVFISSATSMVFDHFQMYQYMQLHHFVEGNKYTPYFGFDRNELNDVFDRYESNSTERQHVLKYLDGYTIKDRSYFSPYSISEFFSKRYFSKPRVPYKSFVRPKNPCKFIWKFLKHPRYLAAVAMALKHRPIEGEFKTRYGPGAFTIYIDHVSHDFNNTESAASVDMMFTLSIEHGIFAPVAENSYDVANYLMYTFFLRHLRLYFKLFLRIDIVQIGVYLNRILHSMHEAEAKTDLQTSLSEAFAKLKIVEQDGHGSSADFVYHSLLHAATYTNESLYMVEDYPISVIQDVAEERDDRRCVSLVRNRDTDTALLIKITRGKSAEIALEHASSYVYHNEGVNVVKYVGIDVDSRGSVSILIGYVDELKVDTIKKYAHRAVGR